MKNLSFLGIALFFSFVLFATRPVSAEYELFRPIQTSPDDLDIIDVGTVSEVVKSDLIRFDSGKRYILDNIRIPATVSPDVKDYLTKTLVGKRVGVYRNNKVTTNLQDPNGNIYGQLQTEDGMWVQQDLVSKGMAWAYSTDVKRDLVLPLYKKEVKAREAKLGIWADPEFAPRNAKNIHAYKNTFQLFDGVIRKVTNNYDVIFFFGDNDKVTFKAVINSKYLPLFRLTVTERMNLLPFTGVRIRSRGWIKEDPDGIPMIEITHPEQIEFPDYEKYDRDLALKSENPPPLMPYDVKYTKPVKKTP